MTNDEEQLDRDIDALLALMDKFSIDPKSKNPWIALSLCLARKHEKEFPSYVKPKRGAPKGARTDAGKIRKGDCTPNKLVSLATGKLHHVRKSPGRPKSSDRERVDKFYLEILEKYPAKTTREAVKLFIRDLAQNTGKSYYLIEAEELGLIERRISRLLKQK